jgi:hypothetical protein
MAQFRSWLRDNATLVGFLVAQALAGGALLISVIIYAVKLEVRVHTMETRGAEYTVDRMNKFDQRITVLEEQVNTNSATVKRIVDVMTRELNKGEK